MAFPRFLNSRILVGSLIMGTAIHVVASTVIAPVAQALKPCEPPAAGRYLLMVRRDSPDVEVALYEGLPESVEVTLCDYQGETVLRLSGFPSQAIAEAWQAYISDRLNRTAYLIEPSNTATPGGGNSYSPQALGDGYAVLVDYFSDLAIARTLRDRMGETPGLVSYGQRPYLLVSHTKKMKPANKLLEELSQDGFAVTVVNSRHAILLRSAITLPQ
ncbi:MAG: hypothetical protein AAF685_06335 [Cyanobacteria bacterium P01_C01_bin.89]